MLPAELLKLAAPLVSGQRAFDDVTAVTGYHRIQASPGFRKAARYCLDSLDSAGLEPRLVSLPADGATAYWTCRAPLEWDCRQAVLTLLGAGQDEVLADYSVRRLHIVQRSGPTPPGGIEAELTAVDRVTDADAWDQAAVGGKVVLVNGDMDRAAFEGASRGALGFINYGMRAFPPARPEGDLPDALQYTAFRLEGGIPAHFGFVVSPRTGQRLRRLIAESRDKGTPLPKVRALVEAKFYPGTLEIVEAVLPGSLAGEIVIIAHLCHPHPSANDNASGCGALLEAARALSIMAASGHLPEPRRPVRFLLVPEINGTYAYLARHEQLLAGMLAGLNLDMVGQCQARCGSVLTAEYPPRALPSFTGPLLDSILRSAAPSAPNWAHTGLNPSVKLGTTPFSGGSDHWLFSDPTVGVPMPMLIQWPDRYYHSSEDTIDKVDPAMLGLVSLVTAIYAAFLSGAGYPEAVWLVNQLGARLSGELQALAEAGLASDAVDVDEVDRRLAFHTGRRLLDLETVKGLVRPAQAEPVTELLAVAREEALQALTAAQCRLRRLTRALHVERGLCTAPAAGTGRPALPALVPVRLHRGPVDIQAQLRRLPPDRRAHWQSRLRDTPAREAFFSQVLFWADGRRKLDEISDALAMDAGVRDDELLTALFEFLAEAGLIRQDPA
ncbi:MAG: DUF4910 domain-containing protein [Bacillota bacterium]